LVVVSRLRDSWQGTERFRLLELSADTVRISQ